MDESNTQWMATAYNKYFSNGLYEDRYPRANPNVTNRILAHVAPLLESGKILDYGCGNGRYLLPILQHSLSKAFGLDVSEVAIEQAKQRLSLYSCRVSLFCCRESLQSNVNLKDNIDLAMLLFGVLAHIEGRTNRREVLAWILAQLKPDYGLLMVSVPNKYRRFWWRQWRSRRQSQEGIFYQRHQGNATISLYYHLYTARELHDELKAVGYKIERIKAESILPEKWVIHSPLIAQIDRILCDFLPAWLGYGILVEARRPS